MRILVTGGAGFIGSNFVRLINAGVLTGYSKVTIIDKLTYAGDFENLSNTLKNRNFHFILGDICNSNLIESIIEEIDVVINFAAESHVDRSINSPLEFLETNVLGVFTILESIRKVNKNVRFLQVSTDEVYGSISSGSWNELSILEPNSPYSASKASAELIIRSYWKTFGLDVVTTRSSNNFGPFHHPEKFIPLSITNLLENKNIKIYGNGLNTRDWIHVDDHCKAIHLALNLGKRGEIYNVGGRHELSNLNLAKQILKAMNCNEDRIDFIEDRKGHDFRYSVETSKIRNKLGFEVSVKFEEGLISTINWYQNNFEWWNKKKTKT